MPGNFVPTNTRQFGLKKQAISPLKKAFLLGKNNSATKEVYSVAIYFPTDDKIDCQKKNEFVAT